MEIPGDESTGALSRLFQKPLLKAIVGAVIGIGLSALLLYALPGSLLSIFLVPVIGFVAPYALGLRRLKHLLVYSIIFLVVLSLAFDASYTNFVYTSPSAVTQDLAHNTTAGYYFAKGDVAPRQGSTQTNFVFTADFAHPANSSLPVEVFVDLYALTAAYTLNTTMVAVSNVSRGAEILTTYTYATPLKLNNVFLMRFQAEVNGKWVNTTESVGAVTETYSQAYGTLLYPSFLYVLLSIATLYVGVVLIAVLIIQSRKRRETIKRRAMEIGTGKKIKAEETDQRPMRRTTSKKEKYVCTSCGAEVDKDSEICPNCGEKFE
ncbi:MAG: zinc-ribbon domain-containing protein [Methanomassiliicoccales archaeon]